MVTDPIADMLIQLKNASRVGKEAVVIPASNLKYEIAKVLEREGYLKAVAKRGKKVKKYLYCELAYEGKEPKINEVKRISKTSRRIYVKADELRSVRQGFGLAVISTPSGLKTEKEARKERVGGELLFTLW